MLLSTIYQGSLCEEHRRDLEKSGIKEATIHLHRIMSVPPMEIHHLLGFDTPQVESAMLIPFPHPGGGFMDHVRVKVFPPFKDRKGGSIKYLQPKGSGVRLYFPIMVQEEVCRGAAPLYLVEGEKKALAVAQLGLPAVGFCGIEGWHRTRSRDLLPDFDLIHLRDRIVELVPDGDWRINPFVRKGVERFALELQAHGSRPRKVILPEAL